MNIRDLRYFLAVTDLGHFGKAAQQCCVSQPTLSGQIKKLEEELGVALFERTNRKIMLTESGKEIAHSARRILQEVDTIQTIAHSNQNPLCGKFSLGAFPTLATYIFPSLVPYVKRIMPDLKLILIEEKTATLLEELRQGTIDAALLALPIEDESLVSRTLFEDEFYLAAPTNHPLTKHKKIHQKQLRNEPLLLLEEGHCLRDQALEICHRHKIPEEHDFKATGMETLRQMVKAGTGITFIPKIAIHPKESGIKYIPFESPAPKRTIGLAWRKTSTRKAVIEHIANALEYSEKD